MSSFVYPLVNKIFTSFDAGSAYRRSLLSMEHHTSRRRERSGDFAIFMTLTLLPPCQFHVFLTHCCAEIIQVFRHDITCCNIPYIYIHICYTASTACGSGLLAGGSACGPGL